MPHLSGECGITLRRLGHQTQGTNAHRLFWRQGLIGEHRRIIAIDAVGVERFHKQTPCVKSRSHAFSRI